MVRSTSLCATLAFVALVFAPALPASEDDHSDHDHEHDHSEVDHYSGKEAKSLREAVTNLNEYNDKLEKILNKENLSSSDLNEIHKYSYTIENALKRIQTELGTMAGDLETMHLSSERAEADTVRKHGEAFLEQARTLTGE